MDLIGGKKNGLDQPKEDGFKSLIPERKKQLLKKKTING